MKKEKEPPSSYSTLLLEHRDGIAQITLNRPEKLNALNAGLQAEFVRCLREISGNDSIRVVILTGKGRGFCSGLDIRDFSNSLAGFSESEGSSVFEMLEAVPQPVIAAINGAAVTGGLELALSCDLLIASSKATFADTHVLVGVPPGAGLSQKLSRIIGLHRALDVSLTGEFFDAAQALQWGLVSRVTEPDVLLADAWKIAHRIAENDAPIVLELKKLIKQGARLSLSEALQLEQDTFRAWQQGKSPRPAQDEMQDVFARNRNRG